MHSIGIFHEYEKSQWSIKDLPWDQLEHDKVKPEYVRLAKSAVMGEGNSIAALHGFLNESTEDYDFPAYASLWGAQGLQHHFVFRKYLAALGAAVDDDSVAPRRAAYLPGA